MGNNSGTHPPLLSRHLALQNLRNINFLIDFSMFDALDACLMIHGAWLKAHGQGRPGEAHGSWSGAGLLGTQRRAGPDPDRKRASGSPGPGRPLAMSHEPPLASPGHEP